jgi:uncharacterized membrane protein YgcG
MAVLALLAPNAIAAESGPLAPGVPAGTAKAQYYRDDTILYVIGIGAIAAGIALAASDHHHDNGGTSGGGSTGGGSTGGGGGSTTTTTT